MLRGILLDHDHDHHEHQHHEDHHIMIMLMIIMKTILIFISRARRKLIGGAALSAEKIALNCPEVGSDMI